MHLEDAQEIIEFPSLPPLILPPPSRSPFLPYPSHQPLHVIDCETHMASEDEDWKTLVEGRPPMVPGSVPRYDKWLQDGLHGVAHAVGHCQWHGILNLRPCEQCVWRFKALRMMCSIPLELTEAVIDGSVARSYCHGCSRDGSPSKVLRDLFGEDSRWMQESRGDHPVFYLTTLTRKQGAAPMRSHMRAVITRLRAYVQPEPVASEVLEVDNAFRQITSRTDAREGRRRFLCRPGSGPRGMVRGRQEQILVFEDAVEQRLQQLDAAVQWEGPLLRPLQYVGYALNFAKRQRQHEWKATNSHSLMHLVHHIFQVLFPG